MSAIFGAWVARGVPIVIESSGMRLAIYRWIEPNAGDDAAYAGLRRAFPPSVEWVAIDLWAPAPRALAVANSCDGLIIGGGTILGNLRTWILDSQFLDGVQVPVGILGTGIRDEGMDAIEPDIVRPLHHLLRTADPIALRGPLSKLFLEECGFDDYPLRVVGDPALLLSGHTMGSSGTAINIRARRGGGERQTIDMLLEFINDPGTCLPRPISFFSCHDKWDLKPCIPIPARIEPYHGLDMLLHRLQRCRLVIA